MEETHPHPHEAQPKGNLDTDLQLNHLGPFRIAPPSSPSPSLQFIANSKHRNWTQKERQSFAAFLHFHHDKIATIDNRKVNRIFKVLSQYIHTRNTNQCRTFAFKMLRKFGDTEKLTQFFRESLPNYQEVVEREREALEGVMGQGRERRHGEREDGQGKKDREKEKGLRQMEAGREGKEEELKPTDTQYPLENGGVVNSRTTKKQDTNPPFSFTSRNSQAMGFLRSPSFLDIPILLHSGGLNSYLQARKTQSASTDIPPFSEAHPKAATIDFQF